MKFLRVKFINGRWKSDLVADYKIMAQFRDEAGLKHKAWPDEPQDYDKILEAAGKHGFGLETIE